MPKIISYTPSWLSRPSPGFQLFSRQSSERGGQRGPPQFENGSRGEKKYSGHRRTIARRGTEVFVVVNNEIRWSDLCMLRDDWEEQEQGNRERRRQGKPLEREGIETNNGSYRVSGIFQAQSTTNSLFFGIGSPIYGQRTNTAALNISKRNIPRDFNLSHHPRGRPSRPFESWSGYIGAN